MARTLVLACVMALVAVSLAGPLFERQVRGSQKKPPLSRHPDCSLVKAQNSSVMWPFLCMTSDERNQLGEVGRQWNRTHKTLTLAPVLLIPGLGGSALDAKLTNVRQPCFLCATNYDWFRAWISTSSLIPCYVDCWYNNIAIYFDQNSRRYVEYPGVQSRLVDWGGLTGIDYLERSSNGNGVELTSYFAPLIEDLKSVGYTPGKNLRGAPFDWRKAYDPDGMYAKLKVLIEEMYTDNGAQKVHLIAHSMGNIHMANFLGLMDQTWKDKFIASFIAVAAPWGGAPKALKSLVSGDNFGLSLGDWFSLVDKLKIAQIARQAGGVVSMLPDFEFWAQQLLVRTPTRSYTVEDLVQLFVDLKTPVTNVVLDTVRNILPAIKAPNLPIHCLYGTDYQTEIAYYYPNGFDKDPEITYTPQGDGTVPENSLRKCREFAQEQLAPVSVVEFDLADHMTVLNDEDVQAYILGVVTTP